MPKFYWRFNHTHICIYKAGWKVECHNVAGKKGKTNCGGQVDIKVSTICPYCDSTLVKDARDYVMSKKTCIGQHLER